MTKKVVTMKMFCLDKPSKCMLNKSSIPRTRNTNQEKANEKLNSYPSEIVYFALRTKAMLNYQIPLNSKAVMGCGFVKYTVYVYFKKNSVILKKWSKCVYFPSLDLIIRSIKITKTCYYIYIICYSLFKRCRLTSYCLIEVYICMISCSISKTLSVVCSATHCLLNKVRVKEDVSLFS